MISGHGEKKFFYPIKTVKRTLTRIRKRNHANHVIPIEQV